MARHAVVDLGLIFGGPPRDPDHDRLLPDRLRALRALLEEAGFKFPGESSFAENLKDLRQMYEPYVQSLSHYLGTSSHPGCRKQAGRIPGRPAPGK